MNRAIFLDRDGVINEPVVRNGKPYPPANVGELQLAPAVLGSLQQLKALGFKLYVVSNQPDVARGTQTRTAVEEIHAALSAELPIDDFFTCYHDDADRCACRKPLPGLLKRASDEYGVTLARSYLVGDRWRDIDAGAAAGCATIFIDRHYDERSPDHAPDIVVDTIAAAAQAIILREQISSGEVRKQ